MSAADPTIERFLRQIKADGRSSPAGVPWHDFYEFLKKKGNPRETNPPVPLILAASAESDASKHARLSGQLQWALENGCLDEAIHYLEAIPPEQWNRGSLDDWEQDSYPRI